MIARRSVAIVVAALAACALVASPAVASQGDRYRGSGSDDGTRANITGSATNNSAGLVYASVAEQKEPPTGTVTALLQLGELKETSSYSSDCGTGSIGLASEREISSSYYCNMYFGGFGTNYRLASVHGSNGWSTYENGTLLDGPWSLGYTGGYSVARAEAYWSSSGPSYDFTWGPSGYTAWQYSTCGGCSYTTISSASSANSGGWNIGSPPSPFDIWR
jgi:hypothetical protein